MIPLVGALALTGVAAAVAPLEPPAPEVGPKPHPGGPVQPQPPAPEAAYFDVSLNGVDHEEPVAALVMGDEVYLLREDLAALGLRSEGVAGRVHLGDEYLPLSSVGAIRSFEVHGLALRIDADPEQLPASLLDLQSRKPPEGIVYTRDASAWLNYAVRATDAAEVTGSGELGAVVGRARAYSGVTVPWQAPPVRGLSNVTLDDRNHLLRVVAGDSYAATGALGGAAYVGGLQLTRTFSLDPYYFAAPGVNQQAVALTPSTLEVYVNDQLVRREAVAPGPVDVTNIPVNVGSGSSRVVLRDQFGREQSVGANYFVAQGALARGVQEYSYSAGFLREGLGKSSFDYRNPALLGFHRLGVSRSVTAGAHVEATEGLASGGLDLLTRWGVQIAGAAGGVPDRPGAAGSLSFRTQTPGLQATALAQARSDAFGTIGVDPAADRARYELGVAVGTQTQRQLSVGVNAGWAEYRDSGIRQTFGLSCALSIPGSLILQGYGSLMASELTDQPTWTVHAGLFRTFGTRTIVGARADSNAGLTQAGAEAQRSLPIGPGYGYRLSATQDAASPNRTASAYGVGQTTFGRAEAALTALPGDLSGYAGVAGGLVWIGGGAHASRPVEASYALVRVPGVKGVQATLNNNPAGRTNRRGDVFVTNLLPYYGNRMGVLDTDVPMDFQVDSTEQLVGPPVRSGAIVVFEAARLRAVRGTLARADGGPVRGDAELRVGEDLYLSPIGTEGAFEFADVPAGRWLGRAGAGCAFTLEVPERGDPILDLGPVACEVSP